MTKKELVAKIAKEQGLDPKKLERMNMEQLSKMDKVVPDEDDLLGDDTPESPSAELPINTGDSLPRTDTQILTPESPSQTIEVDAAEEQLPTGEDDLDIERVLLGYHPVTEKPIYSDEQ